MKTDRKEEIAGLIRENRMVKAQDLSMRFGVSMETIRRDLSDLEKEGLVRRVHGGAVLNTARSMEPDFSYREISNYDEKVLIGREAASCVHDGETIIIDIGTTTLEFARFLKGRKQLTVLTNSLKIAFELMDDPKIKVLMLGGVIRSGEGTTSGYWAEEMMDRFHVDKVFLGVGAIDAQAGITDFVMEETNLRRHFIAHANEVYALTDYSKFGQRALNEVCPIRGIDVLITDRRADAQILKAIREQNVQIRIAEESIAFSDGSGGETD